MEILPQRSGNKVFPLPCDMLRSKGITVSPIQWKPFPWLLNTIRKEFAMLLLGITITWTWAVRPYE